MASTPAATLLPDLRGLEPIETLRRRWPAVLGGVLSAAMVAGIARQLFQHGIAGFARSMPTDPRYYLFLALLYLSPPFFDYVIFRRLWSVPAAAFVALLKKRIANDVVLGYSGEAYFYAWARAHAPMVAAPFGAVKDVSILSAIAGNAITLVMIAIALPIGHRLLTHDEIVKGLGSAAVLVAISLPWLLFSRRVFSLDRRQLWWVFDVHVVRLLAGSTLIALAWHYAMPEVSIGPWLFLAAGRLLVSRLPLVPSKDLLFANFTILLIGQHAAVTDLVAVTAALTLAAHGALMIAFGIAALLPRRSKA